MVAQEFIMRAAISSGNLAVVFSTHLPVLGGDGWFV
jgi:hypothetical protein